MAKHYFIFELEQGLDRLKLWKGAIEAQGYYNSYLESMNMIIREDVPCQTLIESATKYRDKVWELVHKGETTITNQLLTQNVILVLDKATKMVESKLKEVKP